MTVQKPVQRLHNDLVRLRKARAEHKSDVKDLRKDKKELAKDRNELKKDIKQGKALHKELDRDRAQLGKLREGKNASAAQLNAERLAIIERYANGGLPPMPDSLPNPLMQMELSAHDQKAAETAARFDTRITGKTAEVTEGREDILAKRAEIKKDRQEIKHDVKVVKHDHKELKVDKERIKNARKRALNHLLPAEYKMGLKQTNKVRKELGLKAVDHVIRPDTATPGMKRLAQSARNVAMSMGGYNSQGLCATGVSRAIQNTYGIKVWGNGNQIDNNLPRSKFKEVHMPLAKALKIPGVILTWEKTSSSLGRIYGHTAVTLGDGHSSASDFIESNTLAGNASRSGLKMFMPR